MEYREILVEKAEHIATITLNRPEKLNTYTMTMGAELLAALEECDNDPDIRVMVLTGAGKAFCAGMDMSGDTSTPPEAGEGDGGMPEAAASTVKAIFSLRKPVIVAYNGAAVGMGVTMTLPFDIRIAAEGARLGMVFVRRGLIPELASPWLLPRIVGISRAAELMYTGRMLSAREALDFGLVSRVVPDDDLMPAAMELAREIAVNCSPINVALTKRMLYDFLAESDVEKVEKANHELLAWTMTQPDVVEGVMAYMQKRPPDWPLKVPDDLPDDMKR
ncbi:MAG: enoyl-CoA hydratase/isomerase family protein [Actinobacteria bacterium]|nr:enoyl-CoA hydratase/isomerase family protein [Actinomycetota bacterium]